MFNFYQDDKKLKMKVQTYAESSYISLQAKLIFIWHNEMFSLDVKNSTGREMLLARKISQELSLL